MANRLRTCGRKSLADLGGAGSGCFRGLRGHGFSRAPGGGKIGSSRETQDRETQTRETEHVNSCPWVWVPGLGGKALSLQVEVSTSPLPRARHRCTRGYKPRGEVDRQDLQPRRASGMGRPRAGPIPRKDLGPQPGERWPGPAPGHTTKRPKCFRPLGVGLAPGQAHTKERPQHELAATSGLAQCQAIPRKDLARARPA